MTGSGYLSTTETLLVTIVPTAEEYDAAAFEEDRLIYISEIY
jgi:hypothetical protein